MTAMAHVKLRTQSISFSSCQRHRSPRPCGPLFAAKQKQDVIVVGGGIGGLVAAGKLSKEGLSVLLLEKNDQVGGRCQSVHLAAPTQPATAGHTVGDVEGTWRFDTGPSLLLFPDTYRRTYSSLGQEISDHVTLSRVQPAAYRVHFEGGSHLDMLYDVQQMMQQLESVEPGAGGQYLAWLTSSRAALEAGMTAFIERDFDGPLDMLDLSKLLPLLPRLDVPELLGRHHDRLALRFKDERLRAMFSFQDLYVGLSPYNAPGAFSLLAATELTDGVFYPEGGFQKVRDSLRTIAESLGVQVRTGTCVDAVNTTPDGRKVTGVTLHGGETLEADVVITNRDLPAAYGLLQGGAKRYGEEQQERTSRLDFSAGVIAFNWCIAGPMVPGLLHHNVFLSSEYEASWQRATSPATLRRCPNFYVHVPSRTDPSAAPPGCESVMVLLPVANMQQMAAAGMAGGSGHTAGGKGLYADLIEAGREAVLAALCESGACTQGVEALRGSITRELVIGPEEWQQRYGLQHGAAFGLAHGLDQLAAFRPALKDPKVCGLYFTGASTRPGNGVPLCMISADLAAQRVLQDLKGRAAHARSPATTGV